MGTVTLLADPARAWSPYVPSASQPWDLGRVAHLHRRAGFAAPWAVLQRDLREGPEAAIERLLDGEPNTADGRPAAELNPLLDEMAWQLAPGASLTQLQAVWLYRMIFTAHPLRERMTLFWHNHFATSQNKVQNTALMQRQNDLLRTHALGDFKTLLAAIGKDPAMLIWLDSTANRKAKPNENYAREVMELFTLGRGHYTEKDIQEAARAFTGWFLVRDSFSEIAAQHDDGPKTVLGRTGRFGGDDIPPILLAQPACAEFLCAKLVRYFITEVDTIPAGFVSPLAGVFRGSGYDVRTVVKTILRSSIFHDAEVRRHRVKSPVEFTIGTIRALEVLKPTVAASPLADACAQMGMSLYAPPSVAGWDAGPAWANSATMLSRANFALGLVRDDERFNAKALADRHNFKDPKDASRFFVDLLVQEAFDRKVRDKVSAAPFAEVPSLILTAPEYQLS
jgi:uncharacterized protein (DUF1800 family)